MRHSRSGYLIRFRFSTQSFSINGNGEPRVEQVSQLLAIRIRSFGGALGMLAPGATLHKKDLSLVAFKTRSRFQYLRFLLATLAGRQTFSRSIELLDADAVECRPTNGSKTSVFVEADGEVLGTLPARIELARETLTLLVPSPRSWTLLTHSDLHASRSPSCNHRCDAFSSGVSA